MTRLLLLGASGLVGREVLALALADPRVALVVAPTRRPLPAQPRLDNPVINFDDIDPHDPAWRVDAVICALGTTIADAGSQAAFRRVDYDYPLAFARLAHAAGARTFALTSAKAADAGSRVFYSRTKGELEQAVRGIGYESLTLLRPGLLDGDRQAHRPMEQLALRISRALDGVLPGSWRAVPASAVARALVKAALEAPPGVHVIESAQIPR
jgi:uncharacterized protein YbjT (DUF2867 family)